MTDQSQKASSTNPAFVQRVDDAISNAQAYENVQRETAIEKGWANKDAYRGHSATDTAITQRIARATFQPENNTAVRTEMIINEHLKNLAKQLKQDQARQIQYAKELKRAIAPY